MPNLLRRCQIGKPKKPNGGHRVFWCDLILIFDSLFDLKIKVCGNFVGLQFKKLKPRMLSHEKSGAETWG